MARPLKQSTAVDVAVGPFVDATDGVTAETGLTISQADVRLKKNAGAWAQKNDANAATHEENGYYEVPLNTTDTDTLGLLRLAVNESGAGPVWEDFIVVPANVYDSMFSTDKLEVDVVQFGGTNITSSAGRPEVNTTHAAGTAWGSGAITAASIAADAITAAKIANGAIDAATFAADVDAEILSYIVDDATRIDASDLNSKIDSLTFTQAGHVDANIQRINDVAVTGDGSGTPFGV